MKPEGLSGRRDSVLFLILIGCVLAAYAPVRHAGFIWDDDVHVTANPNMQTWQGLVRIWTVPSSSHAQFYPLTLSGFWLQYQAWQLHPLGYHLINVLLHGLNALLLAFLLLRLRCPGAWAAAFLFALHPVCVETVAWISELKNVLSAFFYLSALWSYLGFALKDPGSNPLPFDLSRRGWYIVSLSSFALALLSKTVTCSMPVVALALVWYREGSLTRRHVRSTIPFFCMGAVLAAVTIWVERNLVGAVGAAFKIPLWDRWIIAGRAFWFYLGKLLWPYPLMFIYPRWTINSQAWVSYLYPAAVLCLFGTAWSLRRIQRGFLAAAVCFIAMLFPALGFISVYPMRFSFVADHFQYLASLAVLSFVAVGAMSMLQRSSKLIRSVGMLCAAMGVVILGWRDYSEAAKFDSSERLWQDTLLKNPSAAMAHSNLAQLQAERGDLHGALQHAATAISLRPSNPDYLFNLATYLTQAGRPTDADPYYQSAIEKDPTNAAYHNHFGIALAQQGQVKKAIEQFQSALELDPSSQTALINLQHAQRLQRLPPPSKVSAQRPANR